MRFHIPTKEQILSLKIGDQAIDCFGQMPEVTEIHGRGVDTKGKWYVCYYTKLKNGSVSGSMKEGQLVRTVELSKHYTSHELDNIEKQMLAERMKEDVRIYQK